MFVLTNILRSSLKGLKCSTTRISLFFKLTKMFYNNFILYGFLILVKNNSFTNLKI